MNDSRPIPCDNASAAQSRDESSGAKAEPANRTDPGLLGRARRWIHGTFIQPLVLSKNPPRQDALSVSLGLIIGLIIPVGGQLALLALLRMMMRFSYVIAAAFTLVSNPLNMIPLYYGYYCLGSLVLGKKVAMNFEVFEKLMHPVMDKSYFWEAFAAFADLGCEILVRWTVAAVLLATIFGILGYVVTFRIQEKRCRRAAEGLGIAYEHFLEGLEHETRAHKR